VLITKAQEMAIEIVTEISETKSMFVYRIVGLVGLSSVLTSMMQQLRLKGN
jgi:hypothetical protein